MLSHKRLITTIKMVPMLRVLLPIAIGAALGAFFYIPISISLVAIVLCGIIALLTGSSTYAFVALIFTTLFSSQLHYTKPQPPRNRDLLFNVEVKQDATQHDGYSSTQGRIVAWEGDKWYPCNSIVTIYSDSTFTPQGGEELLVRAKIRAYSSKHPAFARQMIRRGGVGVISINDYRVLEHRPKTESRFAENLHSYCVRRVERLGLDKESEALVMAMVAGEKRTLSPTLRDAYSKSGTAHLLAISGLHVGILFVLVNCLLYPIAILRRGNIVRALLAVVIVWLYAVAVGMTPSVVRATIMFSILQLSIISSSQYRSLNALFATAVIMLIVEPYLLFDIGFCLSFIAVVAILSIVPPAMGYFERRWAKAVVSTVVVSVVATLATTPLISYNFGYISLVGVVINPIVVLLAEVVVALGVVWLLLPIPGLNYPIGAVVDMVASWQNSIVSRAASMEYAAYELRLEWWLTSLIYLIFALIIALSWSYERKKSLTLPSE